LETTGRPDFLRQLNHIRNTHAEFRQLSNLHFLHVDNDRLIAFVKTSPDRQADLIVIINIDPIHTGEGTVTLPQESLPKPHDTPYHVRDLLTNDVYIWHGASNWVPLDPVSKPVPHLPYRISRSGLTRPHESFPQSHPVPHLRRGRCLSHRPGRSAIRSPPRTECSSIGLWRNALPRQIAPSQVTLLRVNPDELEQDNLDPRLDWAIILRSLESFDPKSVAIVPALNWDKPDQLAEGALNKRVISMPPLTLGATFGPPGEGAPNLDATGLTVLTDVTGDLSQLPVVRNIVAMPDSELRANGVAAFRSDRTK